MKKILVVSGSRADYGLLEWPTKVLDESFSVWPFRIWGQSVSEAFESTKAEIESFRPDLLLILGDRFEILAAALAAHLQRVPIAHIGGGDVTEGSYDDAMRDAISRMASIHFVTSTSAMARLSACGYRNIHLVGNPAIDYIRNAPWKKERPFAQPYSVVSYQAETLAGRNDFLKLVINQLKPDHHHVFIRPNPDRGSEEINRQIDLIENPITVYESLPHADFLNLLFHCEEFIGNSSSMLYEAPELGVKTRMIGIRQRGRVLPWGDGHSSERIAKVLRYTQP